MESARGECGEKIFPFPLVPLLPPSAVVLSDSKHLSFLGSEQSVQQEQRTQQKRKRHILCCSLWKTRKSFSFICTFLWQITLPCAIYPPARPSLVSSHFEVHEREFLHQCVTQKIVVLQNSQLPLLCHKWVTGNSRMFRRCEKNRSRKAENGKIVEWKSYVKKSVLCSQQRQPPEKRQVDS